ncbi:MAG: lactate racemase domain-containing protein [Actinobacteria bacterium]|nr:lactate racemase domain-containing protein [Actinomycetota bacterium]
MEYIQNINKIDNRDLKEFTEICLERMPDAKKVLVIFPDYTRVDFTDKIAPLIAKRFSGSKSAGIDFLNAGGTHRKMSVAEIKTKLGLKDNPADVSYLNHDFEDQGNLKTIGCISKNLVYKKTGGNLDTDIDITVNRHILSDYDIIIALSSTIPHEAAGYSGGLKIFFPGISGPEVIDLFHWASVLVGLGSVIGTKDNNARDLINAGAKIIFENIKPAVYSFNMVNMEDENGIVPVGLFIDSGFKGFLDCYNKACELSEKVHIKYIDSPLSAVVQQIPPYYDEIWTAAKGSYKLQRPGVLAPDAEVIIYAPHIRTLHSNAKMEKELYSLGYHCRDYVCHKLKAGLKVSRNAASHVINASGPGIYDPETDNEKKAFRVTLSTGIPEKDCIALGLGYRDPGTLKKSDFCCPGMLWIDNGAKYLYELKKEYKKI